jgi:hypothetical protein
MYVHGENFRISPMFLSSLCFWSGMRKNSVSSNVVSYLAAHVPSYHHHVEVCGRQNDPSDLE